MTTPAEEDFTELRDADIPRVDLVDKAANGMTFLIAKRADGAGLMDPEFIRDLIAKSEPEPALAASDAVTMTGSPAAILKLIHQAAVAKAKYDAGDLKRMAASGEAMDDQSYPVADREDLTRAIRAVGRGGADHDAIRRHIATRAKAIGAASEIPDNWNSDGSLKDGSVTKEVETPMEPDDGADSMDPTVALAGVEGDAPGDPTAPGSPAWEAIDAATARKWTSILARAKHAVGMLAEREMIEAASVDPGDGLHAMDLDDACCAIDYAISVLAPFAVAEQAEADCAADQMAAVGKALGAWDTAPLDTIEALGHVAKAGRVLSSGNEAAIRDAVEQLQKVLASLPAAPTAPDESGQAVAKQEDTVAETATQQAAPTAEPVIKAEQAPQVPIYDRRGNLVGIVDPASIVPVAIDEDDEPEAPAEEGTPEPDDAPETTDLAPEPSAEVGIPADAVPGNEDDVTKTTEPTAPTTDTPSDAESSNTDVTKSPDADSATQEQAIAKQAETIAQLAETVETLKGQIRALEEQPAEPKVFTNGAIPPGTQPQLRGQDRGAPSIDVAKAQELKKTLYQGPDAAGQNAIHTQLNEMAIAELRNIHNGGARP